MALPFIVGPINALSLMALTAGHKWKLSCVYGYRLPNFLMLSYCRWRINAPFFSSQGMELPRPVKAGLQTAGHIGPMPREEAPPYWKAASCAQPKRSPPGAPLRPPKHAPKVDPTHEKLLAVLSQATSIPDTAAVGAATTSKDLPTPNLNEGRMLPITEPGPLTAQSTSHWGRWDK